MQEAAAWLDMMVFSCDTCRHELLGTCIALLQVDKANKAQEVAEKAQNDFIIAKAIGLGHGLYTLAASDFG